MSRKIPLERAIGGAYGFLFSDLLSIIGIAWFPTLLFGGLAAAAIWYGALAHPLPPLRFEPHHPDLGFAIAILRITVPALICAVLLAVMLTTGFVSRALGLMEGTTFFYFSLGVPFWRVLAAFLLAGLSLGILRGLLHLTAWVWHHFVDPSLPMGVAVIFDVLGSLALAFVFVYAVVRLIFLLPAVVVAEERLGLGRAWALGRGNFWRALSVLLAVLLPALVGFAILDAVLFVGALHGFPLPPFAGEEHPAAREIADYVNRVVPFVMNFLKTNWPLLLALQVAYGIVQRALFAGASANAYLGVAPEDEAQA
jgi:hypothetical protein